MDRPMNQDGVAHQTLFVGTTGRHSTLVHRHVVFSAEEAAEVFYAYFLTDAVRVRYTLSELGLAQ